MRKTGIKNMRKTTNGRKTTFGRNKKNGIRRKNSTSAKEGSFEAKYKVVKKLSVTKSGSKVLKVKQRNDTKKQFFLAQVLNKTMLEKKKRNIRQEVETQNKACSLLGNDRVVEIIDLFETDKDFYLVQEFLPGRSVFDKLLETKKKRLINSEVEVGVVILQLLEVLAKCHKNGITHNNLIPTNIIYIEKTKDLDAKIELTNFREKSNLNLDWLFFASPEALQEQKIGRKQDMWMVGVICFQLLSGNVPFYDSKPEELARKISRGQFKFKDYTWKSRSILCKEFIRNCLKVDVEKRISAAEALRMEWFNKIRENSAVWKEIEATRRTSKAEDLIKSAIIQVTNDKTLGRRGVLLQDREKSG